MAEPAAFAGCKYNFFFLFFVVGAIDWPLIYLNVHVIRPLQCLLLFFSFILFFAQLFGKTTPFIGETSFYHSSISVITPRIIMNISHHVIFFIDNFSMIEIILYFCPTSHSIYYHQRISLSVTRPIFEINNHFALFVAFYTVWTVECSMVREITMASPKVIRSSHIICDLRRVMTNFFQI